jgi:hypothetical protein
LRQLFKLFLVVWRDLGATDCEFHVAWPSRHIPLNADPEFAWNRRGPIVTFSSEVFTINVSPVREMIIPLTLTRSAPSATADVNKNRSTIVIRRTVAPLSRGNDACGGGLGLLVLNFLQLQFLQFFRLERF